MGQITHAYIVYKDEKTKFYVVPICDVKCKRNSEDHIKPENDSDFVKTKVYYAKWCSCGNDCEEDHEHYGYYAAFILLLGGSEEDIQQKLETSRRLCIPNNIESEESEEPEIEPPRPKKRRTTAAQEAKQKFSREILEKHKRNVFLTSRQIIVEHNLVDGNNQTLGDNSLVGTNQNESVIPTQEKGNDRLTILADANEKLREELIDKDKEMEQLRRIVIGLKGDEFGSGSTLAIGNTNTEGKKVKRALFQDEDCEKKTLNTRSEEHGDDAQAEKICANTDTLSTKRRPRIVIKSIEKMNLEFDPIIVLKGGQSKSRDSAGIETIEGDANDDVRSAPKKQKLDESLKTERSKRELQSPIKVGDAGCSYSMNLRSSNPESIETDTVDLQPNDDDDDEEGFLPSDGDSNPREDDDTNSTVRNKKRRLESKLKERKSDHMDTRLNKKIYAEIRTALKHYNSDIDEFGLKRYEVSGDKIYLGERLRVSAINWYLISTKKPTIFFKDLLELIWGQRKLVNRCQDITRVTTALEDRSLMKELTPQKKRLTYKLLSDHLDGTRMKAVDKMNLLMRVPYLYSEKINYLRMKHYK